MKLSWALMRIQIMSGRACLSDPFLILLPDALLFVQVFLEGLYAVMTLLLRVSY
jgi:hypothetical protein